MQGLACVGGRATTNLPLPPTSPVPFSVFYRLLVILIRAGVLPLDGRQAASSQPTTAQTLMAANSPVCAAGAAADAPPADAPRQTLRVPDPRETQVASRHRGPKHRQQFGREKHACTSQRA